MLGRIALRRPAVPHLGLLPLTGFATRRLRSNSMLAALLALGLVVASALVTSVPLFSEAVVTSNLRQTLAPAGDGKLPPASLLFRQTSSRFGPDLSPADLQRIDRYLSDRLRVLLPAPLSQQVRAGQTDRLSIFVGPANAQHDSGEYGYFAFVSGLQAHVDVAEGRWPAYPANGGTIEAAMLTAGVDTLGIHVGDQIWVMHREGDNQTLVPVKIVGRWNPRDPRDPYWFNQPDAYTLALIVPEDVLLGPVASVAPRGGRQFTWYFVLDPLSIRAGDAGQLASGIAELRVESQRLWRGLRLESAPDDLLENYQRQTFLLEALLLSLAAPLVLIALQFVAMAGGMRVEQQRGEIATLKSRGASSFQVLGVYCLEGALLGLIATAAGPPLGAIVAMGVGKLTGFFGLSQGVDLPVAVTQTAFGYAAGTAALALVAALLPAASEARATVVTYRQELTRAARSPFWHRAYLDLLSLPLAAYAYLALQQRQSVVPIGAAGDAIPDPVLLLAPALFIFAVTLVFLRLLPVAIRIAEWVSRWIAGPSLLLALKQLSRQPGDYRGLVLMLVMTLAIGVFSASAALTIDVNQADAVAYRVGSDLRVSESGAFDPDTGVWTLLPIGDYRKVPGVQYAARVARLTGKQRLGGRSADVQILAVNPADLLPLVAWRDDYADQDVVDLMSALASGPVALIDRRMAMSLHLGIGDEIPLTIKDQPVDVAVAGFVDYFPTLSPDGGPFLIMNLDQLFDEVGPMPSEVWFQLAPDVADADVLAALDSAGLPVSEPVSRRALLAARQADVSRQGTFGLLAVGFLIGAGLSILSFLIYTYLSFRRRLIQIGILRAIGLSRGQVIALIISEQAILMLAGIGAGLLLGLVASDLFVPFLQIRETPIGPPTIVLTAWNDVARLLAIVGVGLLLVLPTNLFLLGRVRLHEAIKLGDDA